MKRLMCLGIIHKASVCMVQGIQIICGGKFEELRKCRKLTVEDTEC